MAGWGLGVAAGGGTREIISGLLLSVSSARIANNRSDADTAQRAARGRWDGGARDRQYGADRQDGP